MRKCLQRVLLTDLIDDNFRCILTRAVSCTHVRTYLWSIEIILIILHGDAVFR